MRGGGLYACGFAVTFLFLELGSFIEDAKNIGLLFDGHIVEFVVDFFLDSFRNTMNAFIWPVHVISYAQPYGIIALGVAYLLFPVTLKKPIEMWLFGADGPPPKESKVKAKDKKKNS